MWNVLASVDSNSSLVISSGNAPSIAVGQASGKIGRVLG